MKQIKLIAANIGIPSFTEFKGYLKEVKIHGKPTNLFAYKIKKHKWLVSEPLTGMWVNKQDFKTRKKAIQEAIKRIEKESRNIEQYKRQVNSYKVRNKKMKFSELLKQY